MVESFHASQAATAMALEQNMELVRVEHSMVARAGRLAGGCACAPRGERGDARVDGFWKSVGDSADARFLETSKRLRSTVKIFSLCVSNMWLDNLCWDFCNFLRCKTDVSVSIRTDCGMISFLH